MGNIVKDDGKKIIMDPLFPRLHISDAEKGGGPRTPPRNKMAISQHLNHVSASQTAQRQSVHGSAVSRISPHPVNNNGSSLGPQTTSYHDVASYKRSVFSSFGGRATRMATRLDTYQSSGINLNISLTTVKQTTIETTNCQTLCNTGHLKRADYCLYKPQEYRNTRNASMKNHEEYTDDYLVPGLSFGNDHNYTNRTKFPTLSTNTDHMKHPIIVGPKLLDQQPTDDKDITEENKLNTATITEITEEPLPCNSERVWVSEMLSRELLPPSHTTCKRSISVEEPQVLNDINIGLPLKRKSIEENMTCKNGKIDTSTQEVVAPNDRNEERQGSLERAGKVGDVIETNFPSIYNINPEEVSQIISPEQYSIVRRTIIQQQKAFQSQVFELHRLIKVQKVLAASPRLLGEDSFYKLKKTPLPSEYIFPQFDQHKKESLLTIPIDGTVKKTNHIKNDTDKRYYPSLIDHLPLPPPSSVINGSKQPPWCYLPPPPPGNQWLEPVRSPSEGLVYKPYTGPSPPPVGFMTPVYGTSLTPSNSDFLTTTSNTSPYNIPTSYNQQGIGIFPNTPLFTSYGLPTISSKQYSCSPTIENHVNYSKDIKTCNLLIQEKKESDLQGSSGSNSCERVVKDELPLFPTTPMVHETADQCTAEKAGLGDHERIKVIKVVPHNPKLASESAARIFQFIQEERKGNILIE